MTRRREILERGYIGDVGRHPLEARIEPGERVLEAALAPDHRGELHEAPAGRVLALIRMHGRGRGRGSGSGVPAQMRFAQLWTFRDGRATRMVLYGDVDEARREAGLS